MIKAIMLTDIKNSIDEYAKNKTWYLYLPVWFFGIYLFLSLLHFNLDKQPFIIAAAQSFDFFLHEMAHIFTAFLPPILTASAGSFSEILLGTLLIIGALKGRSYFALLICIMWFMLACQSVGIYMADARAQQLPLVSLGGELSGSETVTHDWNFIFSKLHLLNFDTFIGNSVRAVGIIAGLVGILFSAWLMYRMAVFKPIDDQVDSTVSTNNHSSPATNTILNHDSRVAIYPTPQKGPLANRVNSLPTPEKRNKSK